MLYGGNNNWFAAYAYWLFKYRGIDNVRLLDGGRIKWELEDRPLTTIVVERPAASFQRPLSGRPELRAFRDEILEHAIEGGRLVDVRSPAEFTGELMAPPHLPQEQPYVAGHVPGAVNIPWSQAANDDGTFKSADELKTLYERNGTVSDEHVVAHCRIGDDPPPGRGDRGAGPCHRCCSTPGFRRDPSLSRRW